MENSVMNQFPVDPAYILIVFLVLIAVLLILIVVLFSKVKRLNRKFDYFMQGKDAETLENVILDQIDEIRNLKAEERAMKDAMRSLNRNSRASFQKLGIVKYNAFKGMGGNLSTAISLLDYTNSGFILNCVHSREGCYIYVKEVDMGKTDVVLGNEEQEALEQAMGYVKRGNDK